MEAGIWRGDLWRGIVLRRSVAIWRWRLSVLVMHLEERVPESVQGRGSEDVCDIVQVRIARAASCSTTDRQIA